MQKKFQNFEMSRFEMGLLGHARKSPKRLSTTKINFFSGSEMIDHKSTFSDFLRKKFFDVMQHMFEYERIIHIQGEYKSGHKYF